jgi:hypothetical protein
MARRGCGDAENADHTVLTAARSSTGRASRAYVNDSLSGKTWTQSRAHAPAEALGLSLHLPYAYALDIICVPEVLLPHFALYRPLSLSGFPCLAGLLEDLPPRRVAEV